MIMDNKNIHLQNIQESISVCAEYTKIVSIHFMLHIYKSEVTIPHIQTKKIYRNKPHKFRSYM